jgi:UDP-3-O-[3-hydroxymyristoyl] glucosamine N-acyltransferase
MQISNKVY